MRSVEQSGKSYAEARAFLQRLKKRGVTLGLDRMRRLLAEMGNPQQAFRCIHIAGTNGKGSVAAMLESILRTAGWKTGLYTSPHLVRVGERVQVDRKIPGREELAAAVHELRPVVQRIVDRDGEDAAPSYFEFMTALALGYFAARHCDIAVVEVGLGGRLDATNVVTPEASVITSIGFDHCDVLGDTLAQIAAEKAGIIKPDIPVVIGRLPRDAERVIRATAADRRSRVISVVDEYGTDLASYPTTNLEGAYQRWNAATATLTARVLPAEWRISEAAIGRGLASVEWPARWQRRVASGRTVVIDASHNAEGAVVLEENLRQLAVESGRAPIVVVGVLGTARAGPILSAIARHAREIHLVVPQQSRACSVDQLRALIPAAFAGSVVEDRIERIFSSSAQCELGAPGDVIVVTGSIYLAGEVLARLEPGNVTSDNDLQDF